MKYKVIKSDKLCEVYSMIYTVTLNPSLDYVMTLDEFEENKVNRSIREHITPGGKGINVSRSLKSLGVDTIALGFAGGLIGDYLQRELTNEGIRCDFVKINYENRINVKLEYSKETEINAMGPFLTSENIEELKRKLDSLTYGDFLVLSGSIGKGTPEDIYAQIIDYVKNKNVKVIVDTTGIPFLHTLKHRPYLVKPNLNELMEITNRNITTSSEVIEAAKELVSMGAVNVLVSLAEKGAILVNREGVIRSYAPKGYVVTSVGAGDAMIAGFLYSVFRGESNVEALRSGVAAGSASVFSTNLVTLSVFEKLYDEVTFDVIE